MSFSVTLRAPGLAKLKARFRQSPAIVARQMQLGLERSLERQAAETRARTPVKTGTLQRSITWKVEGRGARIYGTVYSPLAYALFVERGTKPHRIRARSARFLRFEVGGRVVFAREVQHPGTKAAHFFADGAKASVVPTRRFLAARLGNVTRFLGYR
jgi:hypothetical protein